MARTRKPWTSGEENRLCELREAGKTGGEIAAELNRTISSVYGRIYRFERMRPIPIIPAHPATVASEWERPSGPKLDLHNVR